MSSLQNNFNGPSPKERDSFLNAARNGDNAAILAFIEKYPSHINLVDGFYPATALIAAAENGHKHTAELLLKKGADVNFAAELSQGYKYRTPMIAAIERGHKDMVKFLLFRGADINGEVSYAGRPGATPLLIAAFDRQVEIVALLLERGADTSKTYDGKTTLAIMEENLARAQAGSDAVDKEIIELLKTWPETIRRLNKLFRRTEFRPNP